MVILETEIMNSYNRLAYNAIKKMQSSKTGQKGKKSKYKRKKIFHSMIHTNGEDGD